jgi:hypothetical protein
MGIVGYRWCWDRGCEKYIGGRKKSLNTWKSEHPREGEKS